MSKRYRNKSLLALGFLSFEMLSYNRHSLYKVYLVCVLYCRKQEVFL